MTVKSVEPILAAIKSVVTGEKPTGVAEAYGISEVVLLQWLKELGFAQDFGSVDAGQGGADGPEIERLRGEIAELKLERASRVRGRRPKKSELSTRNDILDATERLMIRDGYATLSTRKLAKEAGVTPALVNYYFKSRDDLLLAALERKNESHTTGVSAALSAHNPVIALWNFYRTKEISSLELEFMASVTHENSVGERMGREIENARAIQLEEISKYLESMGVTRQECNPMVLLMILTGMARSLVIEEILGISSGHQEVKDFLENCFTQIAVPRTSSK